MSDMDVFDFDAYSDDQEQQQQRQTPQAPAMPCRMPATGPEHMTVQQQAVGQRPFIRPQANNLFNSTNQQHYFNTAVTHAPNHLSIAGGMELFPPEMAPARPSQHARYRCPGCGLTFYTPGRIIGMHQHTCGLRGSGATWERFAAPFEVAGAEGIAEHNRLRWERYRAEMQQRQQRAAQSSVPYAPHGFSPVGMTSAVSTPQSVDGHQALLRRNRTGEPDSTPPSAHQRQSLRESGSKATFAYWNPPGQQNQFGTPAVPSQTNSGNVRSRIPTQTPGTLASANSPQFNDFSNDVPRIPGVPLQRSSMAFDGREIRGDIPLVNNPWSRNTPTGFPSNKRLCTQAPSVLPPTTDQPRLPVQNNVTAATRRPATGTPSSCRSLSDQSCASGMRRAPTCTTTPARSTPPLRNNLSGHHPIPPQPHAIPSSKQAQVYPVSTSVPPKPPIALENLEFHLRAEIDRMDKQERQRQDSAAPSVARAQPPRQTYPLVQGPVTYTENFNACYQDEIERVKRGGSGQNPDPLKHASDDQGLLLREKWTTELTIEARDGRYVSAQYVMRSAVGYVSPKGSANAQ